MAARKVSFFLQEVVVEGSGRFPIDMLRYDSCVPDTESDAVRISGTLDDGPLDGPVTITLRRFAPAASQGPTVPRWASFGWRVVSTKSL